MNKKPLSKMIGEWDNAQTSQDNQLKDNAFGELKCILNSDSEVKKWQDKGLLKIVIAGSNSKTTDIDAGSDIDIQLIIDESMDLKKIKDKIYKVLKAEYKECCTRGNLSIRIKSRPNQKAMDIIVAQRRTEDKIVAWHDHKQEEIVFYTELDRKKVNELNVKCDNKYSKMVRAFKGIRDDMAEKNIKKANSIKSFMIECLLYNLKFRHYNTKRKKYSNESNEEIKFLKMFVGIKQAVEGLLANCEVAKTKLEINAKKKLFENANHWHEVKDYFSAMHDYIKENYLFNE